MQFDFSTWYIVGSLLTHIAPLCKLELDAPLSRHTLKQGLSPRAQAGFHQDVPPGSLPSCSSNLHNCTWQTQYIKNLRKPESCSSFYFPKKEILTLRLTHQLN